MRYLDLRKLLNVLFEPCKGSVSFLSCEWGHGGVLTEKWGPGMCNPEDPFSHSPGRSQDPISAFFSSQHTTFILASNHKVFFLKSKPQSLKISKEFSSRASNWAKIQGLKFGSGPFISPSVRTFWPHTYTKMKGECHHPRMRTQDKGLGTLLNIVMIKLCLFFCIIENL